MGQQVCDLRICRVITTYPSNSTPGSGLPAYHLTYHIHHPTLHIVQKQPPGRELWPLPDHATLLTVGYWDLAIGGRKGIRGKLLAGLKMMASSIFWAKSARAMREFHPTIVHTHTPIPLFHGLFGKHGLKARWVLTLHGSDFLQLQRSRTLQRLVGHADALCYVSKRMAPELRALFPDMPLYYTPNGVDLDQFTDPGLDRAPQILMVGSLRWQKGCSYALQAFAFFARTHPGWRLVILGEGPERTALEAQAAELGISMQVEFVGMCSRQVVAEMMQTSAVFLLTSVTEGFPKVLLEAAACGTPMVATDVGSCREIADRAGFTVPSKDVEAIAIAMTRLADDGALWARCSQEGKDLAKAYSWQRTADILTHVYGQLLSGDTNPSVRNS